MENKLKIILELTESQSDELDKIFEDKLYRRIKINEKIL